MKNKLTKIILGGLSSLLICGAPMSYASLPESKFKLPEHAERAQKERELPQTIRLGATRIAVGQHGFTVFDWKNEKASSNSDENFEGAFDSLLQLVGMLYSDLTQKGYSEQDLAELRFAKGDGTLIGFFESVLGNTNFTKRVAKELSLNKCMRLKVIIGKNGKKEKEITYSFWRSCSGDYRLDLVCQGDLFKK